MSNPRRGMCSLAGSGEGGRNGGRGRSSAESKRGGEGPPLYELEAGD